MVGSRKDRAFLRATDIKIGTRFVEALQLSVPKNESRIFVPVKDVLLHYGGFPNL